MEGRQIPGIFPLADNSQSVQGRAELRRNNLLPVKMVQQSEIPAPDPQGQCQRERKHTHAQQGMPTRLTHTDDTAAANSNRSST